MNIRTLIKTVLSFFCCCCVACDYDFCPIYSSNSCDCVLPSEIEVGMPFNKLHDAVGYLPSYLRYRDFVFFTWENTNVVARREVQSVGMPIIEISCFPVLSVSDAVFATLVPYEDDIYSVVEKVGIPSETLGFGYVRMVFRANTGGPHIIEFEYDECNRYVMYAVSL